MINFYPSTRYIFLVVLSLLICVSFKGVKAQSPGGIPTGLFQWLSADSLPNTVDNSNVGTWRDLSGTGNNASGVNNPRYRNTGFGSKPYVEFNGTNEYFQLGNLSALTQGEVFFAVEVDNDPPANQNQAGFWDLGTSNQDAYYPFTNGDLYDEFGTNNRRGPIAVGNLATANVYNATSRVGLWQNWLNGSSLFQTTNNNNVGFPNNAVLGKSQNARYLDGKIAEFAIFNRSLNSAERIIVQNYFSSKYGIATAQDVYTLDLVHKHDLAGIGRVDVSNIANSTSSAKVLQLSNPSGLQDGEFLTFAHNNDDFSSWQSLNVPSNDANIQRLGRVWRFDESFGDVGSVTLAIDTLRLPAKPAGFTQYALLIDGDDDFINGANLVLLQNLGNGTYGLSGINVPNGAFLAIAAVRPQVYFLNSASAIIESSNAVIPVYTNYVFQQNITVPVSVAGITASAGADFTAPATNVTITAGQSFGNFTVTIADDLIAEPDESLSITLQSGGQAVVGSPNAHVLTINDNDNNRRIKFTNLTQSFAESAGAVNIEVTVNQIDPTNPTTADYAITGGTATPIQDIVASGTVTVPAGNSTATFSVNIIEDAFSEANETAIITLNNPSNAALADDSTSFTITITDNDALPTVGFAQAIVYGSESAGQGSFELQLSAISGQDVTLNISVNNQTAVNNTDFTLTNNQQITIPAGQQSVTVPFGIINDALVEGTEFFRVFLYNLNGATLGTNGLFFYIADNDADGFTGPGGVGDATTNFLWLDASTINQADNSNLGTWLDISGNANNAAGVNNPRYRTAGINGKPVVEFNGTNEYYNLPNLSSFTSGEIFLVGQIDNDPPANQNQAGLWDMGGSNQDSYWPFTDGNIYDEFGTNSRKGNIVAPNLTTPSIYNVLSEPGFWRNNLNSSPLFTTNTNTVSFATAPSLAKSQNARYFDGQMAEVILYRQTLNTAQRKIVSNYLAAKYGIAIADDLFGFETTHSNSVAGLGRDDVSNAHLAARSAGFLTLSSPSNLDDGEFALFGHDGGNFTAWTTTETPSTNFIRVAREWRFDLTGSPGNFLVEIDTSLLPVKNSNFSMLVLLVDQDGDFSSGAVQYNLNLLSGSRYQAFNVNIPDQAYVTVAALSPAIQFSTATVQVNEPSTPAVVEVSLSNPLSYNVTVNYAVTGGTATSGVDFNLAAGQVTITAGNTAAVFNVDIINDLIVENDETIEITLSNPSAGVSLGLQNSVTITVNDDDNSRRVKFSTISGSGLESVSPVALQVTTTLIDPTNPISVDYFISGGTATSGLDATASGTVTIPAGNTTATFDLIIAEDGLSEPNETVIISLTNPQNASLANDSTSFTYTIQDNDALPVVGFSQPTVYGSEATGTGIFELALSSVSGSDVTLNISVNNQTAVNGVDFNLTNTMQVTIPAGQQIVQVPVAVINDNDIEGTEFFRVFLYNLNGATLGANGLFFYISDNDQNGYTGPGGVGDANTNFIWLDATTINQADNSNLGTWTDLSGNARNATGVNNPRFRTTGINGKGTVEFNGTNEYYTLPNLSSLTSGEIFMVARVDADPPGNQNQAGLWDLGSSNQDSYYPFTDGNIYDDFGTTARKGAINAPNLATSSIYNVVSEPNFWENRLNGTSLFNTTNNTVGFATAPVIAKSQNARYLDGWISELFIYNQRLNSAQRKIVQNYLSSKYSIAIANDLFGFDLLHGNHVAGIGRDDASNFHTAAQSTALFTVSSPSNLGDGEFLLFGHDNASIGSWSNNDVPNASPDIIRVAREWRFDATGNVGTVTVEIDTAQLPVKSSTYSMLVLYVDQDGNFASGATAYNLTPQTGSVYQAINVTIPDQAFVTIAAIRPQIQFAATTVQLNEPSTPGQVAIQLSNSLSFNVNVNYAVTGGTATAGSDFVLSSGTATITAGNTSTLLNLTVINDTDIEADETIVVTLSNPTAGVALGANSQTTFTINDDDNTRKIKFSQVAGTGLESAGTVQLQLEINELDLINPTTVDYSITGGTGTAGVDATCTGTATIAAGSSTTTIDLLISEDNLAEPSETIIISLTNPSNASLANDSTQFTYTIQDNDALPTLGFSQASVFGSEASGTGTFELSLSSISGTDVTVNLSVQNNTAVNGTDFTLTNNSVVTIPAGQLNTQVQFSITNDNSVEGTEFFRVFLFNLNGASLGTNGLFFYISDNDQAGTTGPGGVGNQSSNLIWLDATQISQADNSNLGTWPDRSGNNTVVNGVNNPRFRTNGINSLPSVEFNGTNEYYTLPNLSSFNSGEIFMVSRVFNDPPGNQNQAGLWDLGSSNQDSYYPFTDGNIYDDFGTTARKANIPAPNLSVANIYNSVSEPNYWQNFLNGSSLFSTAVNTVGFSNAPSLAKSQNARYFNGLISEVVFYNQSLNSAQRKIVQNYLAAKYNIAIANDLYLFQANYGHEVAGLGRDSAAAQHTGAQSGGILSINSPANLSDGDYLLFGHNNASIATWNNTNTPTSLGDVVRIARTWALSETGDIGNFTIEIDTSTLGARPAGYTNFMLLVDNDDNFTTGAQAYSMTLIPGVGYSVSNLSITSQAYVTIASTRTSIQFQDTFALVSEITSPGVAIVQLSNALSNNVSVNYTVSGTATANSDFIRAAGTATITAGNITTQIPITIINDQLIESNETVILTLSNPQGAVLGSKTTYTLNINDDDNLRKIKFNAKSANVSEATPNYTFTLQSTLVDPTNATSVDYVVTGGTATGGGVDYTLASGTATIPANSSQVTFDIAINEDAIDETDETVIVSLFNPTNANLANDSTVFTLNIQDNDNAPTVQFAAANYSASEASGTGQITVSLSSVAGQTITVNYAVTALTATANADYILANGLVTFNVGDQFAFINPVILEDAILEQSETFRLQLFNPQNTTISGNAQTVFTITDNDNVGDEGPGGVGNSQSLHFWLDATTINQADNSNLGTWNDLSGNNRNATGVNTPRFRTTGINNKGTVEFNGTNEYYTVGNLSSLAGGEIFMVSRIQTDPPANQNQAGLWDMGSSNSDSYYPFTNGNLYDEFGSTARRDNMTFTGNLNVPNLYNVVSIPNLWANRLNGTVIQSLNVNTVGFATNASFAKSQNARYLQGQISELILFNQSLNTAQRKIVENYLGAKYDLTLADDKYVMQASHGFEVAGIGQEDALNFHTSAKSGDLLSVSSPSGLANGEYMLFGHDNQSISSYSSIEAPDAGASVQRVAREYVFDISGGNNSVGTVTIGVETALLPALPAGFDSYVLLVDADGDFSAGATEYTLSQANGTYYEALSVNIADLNFITFGAKRLAVAFTDSVSGIFEPQGPALIQIRLSAILPTNTTVNYTVTGGTASAADYVFNAGTATIPAGSQTAFINFALVNDNLIEADETVVLTLSNPSGGVLLGDIITHRFTIQDDDNLRKVQFTNISATGSESITTVNVGVEINSSDPTNPTTVEYFFKSGTATAGVDVQNTTGTVTIPANSTSASFSFNVVDDAAFEANETVVIGLRNPTNANLSNANTEFTYTITDNDVLPAVQFTTTGTSISEAVVSGPVEVSLSSVSGSNVSVNYVITAGSATPGVDFILANGTATITAGNLFTNINVVIVDDFVLEGDETFTITLQPNPTNATLGANTVSTVTVLDNEINPAQSPGGVSNTLAVWLRADRGVEEAVNNPAEVNDEVAIWKDQSQNAFNATGLAGLRPNFVLDKTRFNGYPSISFNGATDWLQLSGLTNTLNSNHTVLAVVRPTAKASNGFYLSSNTAGTDRVLYGINASGGVLANGGVASGVNYQNTPILLTHNTTTNNTATNYVNATPVTNTTGFTSAGADRASIGQAFNGTGATGDAADHFAGDIAEIVVYQSNLASDIQARVESYLALKYGLTKQAASVGGGADERDYFSSSGNVVFDYDVMGLYVNDIAGLGADNNSALNIRMAKSANADDKVIGFRSGGFPTDQSYVIWANDNQLVDTVRTGGSANYSTRSGRTWRTAVSGTPGTVDLFFLLTPPLFNTGSAADYALLIKTADANFTTGATEHITGRTIVGDTLKFTNVAFTNLAYFTLGVRSLEVQSITNGNWNSAATWSCNCVPDSANNITLLHTVNVNVNASAGNLQISAAGNLNFTANSDFVLKGNLTNSGAITATTGRIILRGSQPQILQSTVPVALNNLTMAAAGGASIAAATSRFSIYGTLQMNAGIFTTNSLLAIGSTATATGSLGIMGAGTFNGDLITERYLAQDQDFRIVTSPIQGQTIASLNDDIYTTGFTGSDWPASSFNSISWFNESVAGDLNQGYVSATNVTNPLEQGRGYFVYAVGNETIDFQGTPITGNINLPITFTNTGNPGFDGFNLVGNPYASTIDWDSPSWTKTNVANGIYFYNSAINQYSNYVNGISINGGSRFIPSHQGFWVVASGASPQLTATENVKVSNQASFFGRMSDPDGVLRITATNALGTDEAVIREGAFNDNYSASEDGVKFFSPAPGVPVVYSLTADNVQASVNALQTFDGTEVIPVYINAVTVQFSSTLTSNTNFSLANSSFTTLFEIEEGVPYNLNTSGTQLFYLVAFTGANPLPVTLLNFSAKAEVEKVRLDWSTSSEVNNHLFLLEKSADAKSFAAFDSVVGAGTTSEARQYFSYDFEPNSGMNYYRLVQRDFDGTATIFQTVAVNFSAVSKETLVIKSFPERFEITANQVVQQVEVYDLKGALIELYRPAQNQQIQIRRTAAMQLLRVRYASGATDEIKLGW